MPAGYRWRIPWTAASAFIYGALEVGAAQYGPFAVLNLVTPLCSLCMAFLGLGMMLPGKKTEGNGLGGI
ncbi:MAG: hypothetical protein HFG62_03930 [Lachnospiraceae bacterium]|nr:hypothetical protein [Lachnospiraceae bacterium]MCI8958260.1 hypothetical protein [Lachnospiraceae bacterium]